MSTNFNQALSVGKIGEEIAKKILPNYPKCWFCRNVVRVVDGGEVTSESNAVYCSYNPKLIDVRDDKWYQQTDDVDFILECQCPVRNQCLASTHEVKTNIGTHASAKPTQNIVIETVESISGFSGNYVKTITNEVTGEIRQVRKGVGWYNKRMDGTKATWYHFYQPFKDDLGKDVQATIIKATDEEKRVWLEDEGVADGSVLITQFPLNYMLSITGEWLKHIVGEGQKNKNYPEVSFSNSRGYLVPIIDIVSGFEVSANGTIRPKEGRFLNPDEVVWQVTDESLIKKNTGHKENTDTKLYMPQRLLDEVESTYRDFQAGQYRGRGQIELPAVMIFLCEKAIPYPI